jgi:pyridinium-3,5-biscarboxylic acid mononucleotide synthase
VDNQSLRALISDVAAGHRTQDEAVALLSRLPFADVGDALVDHHRTLRQGQPEVVYGPGKSPDQCVMIVSELMAHSQGPVLVTRVDAQQHRALSAVFPGAVDRGGTLSWRLPTPTDHGVLVVSAGTADVPVLEECIASLAAFGMSARRRVDVGVAGLHRFLAHLDEITSARLVIVVAGMEGALASVVGGVTSVPVIAVPTSVGYGSGLDGVTALLAMTASCASGVTVVGIDNGFGAAAAAARWIRSSQ